jgi:SAM-dependent methyltransferase
MTSDTRGQNPDFLDAIAGVFDRRLDLYGAQPKGVLWRTVESQRLRFDVMVQVFEPGDRTGAITINDLGCGYGAFFDYLAGRPVMAGSRYMGYDICAAMVAAARGRIADPRAFFVTSATATADADYSFASGTYNLRGRVNPGHWNAYVKASLGGLWARTTRALAFNMLDARAGKREKGLYYAHVEEFRAFCTRALSPKVTVITDYPLEDWTMLVRR